MQHVADVRVRLIDFVENDDPRLLDKSGNQAEHEGRFRASWRCDLPERADDLCTGEIAIERDLVHGKPDASTELFEEFGFAASGIARRDHIFAFLDCEGHDRDRKSTRLNSSN